MAYVGDLIMIAAVTRPRKKGEPPSIRPLEDYLRRGQPFTPTLREWLLKLLADRRYPYQLKLLRRRGRRLSDSEVTAHVAAYNAVTDLTGQKITTAVYQDVRRRLNMAGCFEKMSHTTTYFIGHKRKYAVGRVLPDDIHLVFKFSAGRKISKQMAIEIAARQFHRSPSSIKNSVLQIERAGRQARQAAFGTK